MMRTVLLVDDHAILRKGLEVLLSDLYPGLTIYEADNGDNMLSHFKEKTIDLLIMDVQMPDTDTIGLVELVSIKYPHTYILIFSMLPERIYGRRLFKAGANRFLAKESSIEDFKSTFDEILHYQKHITTCPVDAVDPQLKQVDKDPFSILSHREFEIMNRLLAGNGINDIVKELQLKPSTIGTYKARIFEKLKVKNLFELRDLSVIYSQ